MEIKQTFLLFLCLFLFQCSGTKNLVDSKTTKSTVILDIDRLGYIYFADSLGSIHKLNREGIHHTYLNDQWGNPTSIDAFNPQKLLVYYQSYNKIVILDQSLSSQAEEDLEERIGWQISCIGMSNDQVFWIYDNIDRRIKKISGSGEELVISDPIYFNIKNEFHPLRIIERGGLVILSDPHWGWFRFDLFGQFVDYIPQKHKWFGISNLQSYIYWINQKIYAWTPGSSIPILLQDKIETEKDLQNWLMK